MADGFRVILVINIRRLPSRPTHRSSYVLLPGTGRYSALGLEMALSVVIGMGIGHRLDRWLGTGPWLMVAWLALGFAAGVRSLYRAAVWSGKD